MAIEAWPYVSIDGDRKITAGQEAEGYELFVDSGVVPGEGNELTPAKVADTLNVSISTGAAIIAGHRVRVTAAATVTLDAGSAQPRIDIVALESNENTDVRGGRLVVVKGEAAASPTAPDLTQDSVIWQLPLAQITVPAGAANLNSAVITDVRTHAAGRHNHTAENVAGLQAALAGKSDTGHTHDERYYTETEMDTKLAGKAAAVHTHDDRYYTEAETNSLLAGKSDAGHTHTSLAQLSIANGIPVDQARVVNVYLNSTSPPAAASVPGGTLYIKYV